MFMRGFIVEKPPCTLLELQPGDDPKTIRDLNDRLTAKNQNGATDALALSAVLARASLRKS